MIYVYLLLVRNLLYAVLTFLNHGGRYPINNEASGREGTGEGRCKLQN